MNGPGLFSPPDFLVLVLLLFNKIRAATFFIAGRLWQLIVFWVKRKLPENVVGKTLHLFFFMACGGNCWSYQGSEPVVGHWEGAVPLRDPSRSLPFAGMAIRGLHFLVHLPVEKLLMSFFPDLLFFLALAKPQCKEMAAQGHHRPGLPAVPPKAAGVPARRAVGAREGRRRSSGLKLNAGKGDERCFPQRLFNCLSSCFS